MKRVRRGVLLACLAVSAVAVTRGAGPQDAGRLPLLEQQTAGTFKSAVDLVTLNVAVTDARNRPVPGLGRADFEVFEDGVEQDVSFFAANEVPLDVVLLIDSSSSMLNKMPLVEQAASGFIDAFKPSDRGAVMAFASQLKILQPFTTDHQALKSAVRSVVARGSTALFTSLYVALDNFERARRETSTGLAVRRQAIVVLTDGEDTGSVIQFDDLLDRARRVGVAVYPISLTTDADLLGMLTETDAKRYYNRADYTLRTLAKETGARAFFPAQLSDLAGVYGLVAEELSSQYALGYVPKLERRDGSFRRIAVRLDSRLDARPRTRTGYYAPGPARAFNAR